MVKSGLAFGGILAIFLSGVGIYNNIYAATEGSTKFSVDVNQAVLELTVPANPAVIDLNPTMANASFGSTSINIHVATNNITGYTLTMTPTNNQEATSLIRTELIEDEEEYREIETLELTDPISTGYTEDTFTANAWGYKITGDNYYGINPENTTVSHPAWTTDAPTNGTNHILTLAAKVDADTVSGAYETTLNFHAVTNSTVAKDIISFDANGGTGTMNDITVTAGSSTTLPTNTFTPPTGMKFIGWSTTQNGQGQGVRYYDDEATYTATDIGYNVNLTLYAQWTNENTPTPQGGSSGTTPGTTLQRAYEIAYTAMHKGMYEEENPGSNTYTFIDSWNGGQYQGNGRDVRFLIQDMTPEICASATALDSEALVLDIRDQTSYHIIKTRDGGCWMQDNLALNLLDANIENALSSDNTNASDFALDILYNGGRSHGDQYATSGVRLFDYYSNSVPLSISSGGCYYVADCYNWNVNTVVTTAGNGYGKVGTFYNYCAATAGTYCYGNERNVGKPVGDAIEDICPYNWSIPSRNDFTSFKNSYDTSVLASKAISASLAGYLLSYAVDNQNKYGFTWLSTRYDDTSMYEIITSSNSIYDNHTDRIFGFSIRCIAK